MESFWKKIKVSVSEKTFLAPIPILKLELGVKNAWKCAYIIYEWPHSSEGSEDGFEANNHATAQNCSSSNPPNKYNTLDE